MRVVTIPAIHRQVTIRQYVRAIQRAKAHPDTMFSHGLTTWWPTNGRDIVRQFREGMHQRINDAVPYVQRGTVGS